MNDLNPLWNPQDISVQVRRRDKDRYTLLAGSGQQPFHCIYKGRTNDGRPKPLHPEVQAPQTTKDRSFPDTSACLNCSLVANFYNHAVIVLYTRTCFKSDHQLFPGPMQRRLLAASSLRNLGLGPRRRTRLHGATYDQPASPTGRSRA